MADLLVFIYLFIYFIISLLTPASPHSSRTTFAFLCFTDVDAFAAYMFHNVAAYLPLSKLMLLHRQRRP